VRIDCFIQIILVRTKRRRLAKATVRALVFPRINNQIIFVEMVIRTRETGSTALGAITNLLTFSGHFFGGESESFRPFMIAASLERNRGTSRYPLLRCPQPAGPIQYRTPPQASQAGANIGSVAESAAVPTGWLCATAMGMAKKQRRPPDYSSVDRISRNPGAKYNSLPNFHRSTTNLFNSEPNDGRRDPSNYADGQPTGPVFR